MPRLTLSKKIFLALATLLVVLLLTFAAFSVFGLQRGLGAYVAEIEIRRMDWLTPRLLKNYAADNGWSRLRSEPQLWARLLRGEAEGADAESALKSDPRLPPWYAPRPFGEPGFGGPAGGGRGPDFLLHLYPPPPLTATAGGDPPRVPEFMMFRRLAVLDASGGHVAGAEVDPAKAARLPLRDHGRLVGYLALAPIEAMESEADRAFLAQQRGLVAVTGLVGLVLALALSWWLSRRWFAPIDDLADAAQSIARGRLQTRVKTQGSDEIAFLGRTFNYMAERLDTIEASRRVWLTDVSHELRTPLAAMRAEIEALQDGVRSFDDRTALRLHRQVMRLGQLVDDLRSSMQGTEAPQERAPVFPLAQLKDALATTRDRFAQRRIEVDTRPLEALAARSKPMLEGDGRRLHQAFMNLLENTLRYTDPGGRLQIGAQVEGAGAAQRLLLSFDDSAPGVTAEELPHLFDRLFRGESSRSRESGGSGLGLSICRAIVEAHGGFIDAADSALGGLRITLTLPLGNA
ncbi:MAG: HAMP domain-containing protein [Proteobacteria bacterium]|nr:HAMP domain-containing protein [Pseudomonadota bacterium]